MQRSWTTGLCLVAAGFAFAQNASAHIRVESPTTRYAIIGDGSTTIKSCPCGVGSSNRTCDLDTDSSDPDRNESRANTFEAGSTITIRFDEFIGHSGRYRVAFDADGADMDDFNDFVLLDVADPAGNAGNAGGSIWELDVTLPDMTCDNCTIQLVQAMHGDTVNPVLDPAPLSSYYACFDVTLVAPGQGTDVGMEPQDPGDEMDPNQDPMDDPALGDDPEGDGAEPGDDVDMDSSGSADNSGDNAGDLDQTADTPSDDGTGDVAADDDVDLMDDDEMAGEMGNTSQIDRALRPLPDSAASEGGGCSVPAGQGASGGAVWLLALLVPALRRRRG